MGTILDENAGLAGGPFMAFFAMSGVRGCFAWWGGLLWFHPNEYKIAESLIDEGPVLSGLCCFAAWFWRMSTVARVTATAYEL